MLVHKKPAVGARGFFALASAKPEKKRGSAKKKEHGKSQSADRGRKKQEFMPFLPSPHLTGSPVLEPKAIGQGKNQGF
jgi:hypothetical protein